MTRLFIQLLLVSSLALPVTAQETTTDMESWNYPYTVHHLSVNDSIDLAYVDEGEGPTLLFIHGLGSNLQAWQKNIEQLKADYRCIAIDLPGYGKSGRGDLPYGMSFFADQVLAFMDSLELKDVGLVGHSMGGQIAIHIALRNDPKVKQLALMAPAGFEQFSEAEHQWFATYVRPEFIQATTEPQIVRNFEANFFAMPEDARFMIEDRLEMRADEDAYTAYCQMIPHCVMGMLKEPVYEQLGQLQLPVMVVYGADDALIPNRILHPTLSTETVATEATALIPGAELHLLDEAGHFVQWEQAEAVNELLLSFFRSK